jgi:hypothetical protein
VRAFENRSLTPGQRAHIEEQRLRDVSAAFARLKKALDNTARPTWGPARRIGSPISRLSSIAGAPIRALDSQQPKRCVSMKLKVLFGCALGFRAQKLDQFLKHRPSSAEHLLLGHRPPVRPVWGNRHARSCESNPYPGQFLGLNAF